ncbi:MAG: hypothetical protein R3F61_17650 [Myxococcota bacterium]
MTCEEAREALLTMDPTALGDLPHLAECDACRSLAEALGARHGDLDRALSTFAHARPAPAEPVQPANRPWRWRMSTPSALLAAAAAATLFLGARSAFGPGPQRPAADPCAQTPELEASALAGTLTKAEIACLAAKGTSMPNRMLIVDAWERGDLVAWREWVDREQERSIAAGAFDPDLGYKLALHCAKNEEWPCVVESVTGTLGRVDVWDEKTRESRTRSLLKLRARAGAALAEASDDPAVKAQAAEWLQAWEAVRESE